MSRLPQRGLITTLGKRIAHDRLALTDELKLGEDNCYLTKVHPQLNCVTPLRPCVCVLAIETFSKILITSERMHLFPVIRLNCVPNSSLTSLILLNSFRHIAPSAHHRQHSSIHIYPAPPRRPPSMTSFLLLPTSSGLPDAKYL